MGKECDICEAGK